MQHDARCTMDCVIFPCFVPSPDRLTLPQVPALRCLRPGLDAGAALRTRMQPARNSCRTAMLSAPKKMLALALISALLLPRPTLADLTEADLKRMRAEKRVALVIGNGKYQEFQ